MTCCNPSRGPGIVPTNAPTPPYGSNPAFSANPGGIPGGTGFPGSPGGFPGSPSGFNGPNNGNYINFNPTISIDMGQALQNFTTAIANMMQQFVQFMADFMRQNGQNGTGGTGSTTGPGTTGTPGGTTPLPSGTIPTFVAPTPPTGTTQLADLRGEPRTAALNTRFPGLSTATPTGGTPLLPALGDVQQEQWGGAVRFQNGVVNYNNGENANDGYTITTNGSPGSPGKTYQVSRDGGTVTEVAATTPKGDAGMTRIFPRLNDLKTSLNIGDLGAPTSIEGNRFTFKNGIVVEQNLDGSYNITVPRWGSGRQNLIMQVDPQQRVSTRVAAPES